MKSSHLNSRLLLGTLIVLALGGLLLVCTHSWQMKRHAASQLELARQAEAQDDADELLLALNRYLRFDPANNEIRTRYALALAERATSTRDRWRALQVLRQVMSETPDRSEVRTRAVELALALAEPAHASKYLEPLLKQQPQRADLHVLASRCELAQNHPQAAADSLVKALELAPGQIETAQALVNVHADRLGQPRRARGVLDRFVKANPKRAAGYLARARLAMAQNRLDDASSDLEVAGKLAPLDPDVALALAELQTRQGHLDQASETYKRAVGLAPERIALYLDQARLEQRRGDLAAALEATRLARKKAPRQTGILFFLGDLLIDAGKAAEAGQLEQLVSKDLPGHALFLRGRLAQRRSRWLDAIDAYIAALKAGDLTPVTAGRAYFEMARCYAAVGGRQEQLQALQTAVGLNPTREARYALAQTLVASRRFDEALPLLRELSKEGGAPSGAWALLARVLVEKNRITSAPQRHWSEVEDALERGAADPNLEVTLALTNADMLALRDEPEQARQVLEAAASSHPQQPSLYLALADLASRQGDRTQASSDLARGDKVLQDRLDWLWLRIDRLTARRDDQAYRELSRLELRGAALSAPGRAQFERHLVEVHAHLGNHADVERLCAQLLAYRSKDTQVRLWLIESLLARRDLSEALRQVDLLHKIEGDDGIAWRCARAEVLMRRNAGNGADRAEARQRLEEAQKARPSWPVPIYLLARLDDLQGQTDQALARYRRVLKLGDYRPVALTRTLEILDDRKRWEEALAVCERALQQGALDRDLQRVAANLALKSKNKARARDLAMLAVPEGSKVYRDQIWLGRILDAADQPTAAREAFERALNLAPDGVEPYLALIAHHVRQGDRLEAAEILEQMKATVDPQRSGVAVARASEAMSQPDVAEQTYRDILQQNPRDAETLFRLSNLLLRFNRPLSAQAVLLRLLDPRVVVADEDLPDLRRQLALVLTAPEQKADHVDEALRLLDANKQQVGDGEPDQRVRALVLARRPGQRRKALATLAAMRGPMTVQEQLRLAQTHDALGNWAAAKAILLELIQADKDNSGTLAVLIDGLLRSGHPVEASTWIERLDRLEPGSERVSRFRGALAEARMSHLTAR